MLNYLSENKAKFINYYTNNLYYFCDRYYNDNDQDIEEIDYDTAKFYRFDKHSLLQETEIGGRFFDMLCNICENFFYTVNNYFLYDKLNEIAYQFGKQRFNVDFFQIEYCDQIFDFTERDEKTMQDLIESNFYTSASVFLANDIDDQLVVFVE